MKITEIKEGKKVKNLTLRVTRRWNIRTIINGFEEFSDDGPLKREKSKVFTILVRDETCPEDHTEMMLFFYDIWAEKCFFIQNGDKLILSGASEMIYLSNGDLQDFPLCLVFTSDITSELTIESVNIDNLSRSTQITTRNVSDVVVPIWKGGTESQKRKRTVTGEAPIVPRSTRGVRISSFETGGEKGATPYEYISISAIPSYAGTKTKLNFYGVVTSYQQPKYCNGKHNFALTFTIVEPLRYPIEENTSTSSSSSSSSTSSSSRLAEASEPLSIQCFADDINSFPPIRRVGDLIRLHRCNFQIYQNRPQILWFQQKSSYLLFSHPLIDELIGLPSFEEDNDDVDNEELKELKLEEFSSSETYHIDERVERNYIRFLSTWSVGYFLTTGYTDSRPKSVKEITNQPEPSLPSTSTSSVDPNKFYHVSVQKLKEIATSTSPSSSSSSSSSSPLPSTSPYINTSAMDFIGMFVGLFPSVSSSRENDTGAHYIYAWDGSCEGGIYPSNFQLPDNFPPNDYLQITPRVYQRIELSVKIICQYNETINQLLKSSNSTTTTAPSIDTILNVLHESLSQLINERDKLSSNISSENSLIRTVSRYLPGGFGILALPPSCTSQIAILDSLQPGTWIRARKIMNGSVENIPHLCRNEIVSARLTVGSSINVLPPFHFDVLSLGKIYDQFRKTCLSAHSIPKSLPRRLYSSNGQPYTPLALVLASPTPAKFLSLVKIVSYYPDSFENFVVHKSTGLPPSSGQQSSADVLGLDLDPNDLTYMFALRIHDDTAYTDAIVYGAEGDIFFNGLSPHQFITDQRIKLELKSYLDKIIHEGVIFELNLITYLTPATPLDAPASCNVKRVAITNSSILPQWNNRIEKLTS